MLLVVSVIVAGFLQTFAFLFVAGWYLSREKRRIRETLDSLQAEWFTAPEAGKPHKAALVLDAAGAVVGSAAARSIMASLSADASHTARAANGVSEQIEAHNNPLLGLLSGGKRGKGAAVARLAALLMPALSGGGREAGGNGGSPPNNFVM